MPETAWVSPDNLGDRIDSWFYRPTFFEVDAIVDELSLRGITCESIGTFGTVDYGFMPTEDYWEKDIGTPFLRTTNFDENLGQDLSEIKYVNPDASRDTKYRLRGGDVLVIQCGNYTGKITFVDDNLDGWAYPSFSLRVRCNSDWDSGFLAIALASRYGQLQLQRTISVTSVRPNTTKPAVEGILIPRVDKAVQTAIGWIVRRLQQLRTVATETKAGVDELLIESLGGVPEANLKTAERPTGWFVESGDFELRFDAEYYLPEYVTLLHHLRTTCPTKPLGDIEVDAAYGILPSSDEYGTGSLPLLRGKDLNGSLLAEIPTSAPLVPEHYATRGKASVKADQILLLIKGATIAEPQSVSVVDPRLPLPAIVNGSIYKFSVTEGLDPYYICAFLRSPFGLKQKLRAIANTGIYYNDQDAIRSFVVPILDLETQRTIGSLVKKEARCVAQALDDFEFARSSFSHVLKGTVDVAKVIERGELCRSCCENGTRAESSSRNIE